MTRLPLTWFSMNNLKHKNSNIAVVIPAYKLVYLEEVLESLAKQTCKQFTVYVGDDASPHDLEAIVSRFSDRINVFYKRFEKNLGGSDLVSQWERCIDLVQNEEWIWFFSDDDRLDEACMEKLNLYLATAPCIDLIHFNVKIINGRGDLDCSTKFPEFPELYTAAEFAKDRLYNKQHSFMVEFVFRKSHFESVGRFQRFDLAWGSDVATCIKLAHPRGIRTIKNSYVYWRRSSHNISPNNSRGMVVRKLSAVVDFFVWLNKFCEVTSLSVEVSPLYIYGRRWLSFRGRNGIKKTFQDIGRLVRI